jgi:hypothetical protein
MTEEDFSVPAFKADFECVISQPKINCPKHGIHEHMISSTIKGHEGSWCMKCWLESLGPALPVIQTND